jgi:hypothetical protein
MQHQHISDTATRVCCAPLRCAQRPPRATTVPFCDSLLMRCAFGCALLRSFAFWLCLCLYADPVCVVLVT